jgi:E1A/CREB-binding protein
LKYNIVFVQPWHSLITQDLRNHLVARLIKAIYPLPNSAARNDPRLRELVIYARRVEKDMFEAANDHNEYYDMLTQKIYWIQSELQEKKLERRREGKLHL